MYLYTVRHHWYDDPVRVHYHGYRSDDYSHVATLVHVGVADGHSGLAGIGHGCFGNGGCVAWQ